MDVDEILVVIFSGGGTVDFQEFVAGLSAFSSKGGREEKLKCLSQSFLVFSHPDNPPISRFQSLRYRS
jgi:Ca2+-binding EF-hand superfamily protein